MKIKQFINREYPEESSLDILVRESQSEEIQRPVGWDGDMWRTRKRAFLAKVAIGKKGLMILGSKSQASRMTEYQAKAKEKNDLKDVGGR